MHLGLLISVATAAMLLPCPPTHWDATPPIIAPSSARPFIRTVVAPDALTIGDEHAWLASHADEMLASLQQCGVVHFRGFASPKTQEGFREFCSALPLQPCFDPLSSIGVRSLMSAADGIYEAVDAESTADTFIGLHNDATYKLAAPYAAFVCFQRAASGGTFLVADGQAILRSLSPEVRDCLVQRQMRVRVAALPIGGAISALPPAVQDPLRPLVASIVRFAIRAALPLDLDVAWDAGGDSLQVLEQPKPAFNRHPATKAASFFSGVHSQSRTLQQRRAGTAFSGVAATDVFWGDGSPIEGTVLDELDAVISAHTTPIAMVEGDVVLVDTYSVLHGRETFAGPRQHAVQWLTEVNGGGGGGGDGHGGGGGASALSGLVNRFAVKRRTRDVQMAEGTSRVLDCGFDMANVVAKGHPGGVLRAGQACAPGCCWSASREERSSPRVAARAHGNVQSTKEI